MQNNKLYNMLEKEKLIVGSFLKKIALKIVLKYGGPPH